MRMRNVCFAVIAVMLFSGAAGPKAQWLTKKGAKPDDRVLGRAYGGDFVTCNRVTVKMAEIADVVLVDTNMSCPSNHPYSASIDGGGGDDGSEAKAKADRDKIERLKQKSKP
jgi:hypothetical protein